MADLDKNQQSIYDLMAATLSSLAKDLKGFILGGDTSPDTLALELSQTKAYKQRFAGNDQRIKNGLPELKPAEYIALEEQYGQVMRAYGLPKGFYDGHGDFNRFIGNDLSPSELASRAQVAHDQYIAAPDYVKQLWTQYFGGKGDAIAAILDPETATSIIQDRGQQIALGGAAAQNGLNINQGRARQLQQSGVTLDSARKAYQQIAASAPIDQTIAKRFGTTFDQSQEENDLLLGQGAATQKRASLYGEEESLFKTAGATDSNALSVSQSY